MADDDNSLTGDVRNYEHLRKRGDLPSHVRNYGDWLAWKKRRSEGIEDPPSPEPPWGYILVTVVIATIIVGVAWFFVYMFETYPQYSFQFLAAIITGLVVGIPLAIKIFEFVTTPYPVRLFNKLVHRLRKEPLPTKEVFWERIKPRLLTHLETYNAADALSLDVVEITATTLYKTAVDEMYNLAYPTDDQVPRLSTFHYWLDHPDQVLQNAENVIVDLLLTYVRALPKWAVQRDGVVLGTVSAKEVVDVRRVVTIFFGHLFTPEATRLQFFGSLRHQLNTNRYIYSKQHLAPYALEAGRRLEPEDYTGKPDDLITTYLTKTPLATLFEAAVEYRVATKTRFEHMHIVAPSGGGKTHGILETLIMRDIEERHGAVIISPNDELLGEIAKLSDLHPDRVTFIDPEDTPALGIFDVATSKDELTTSHIINELAYFCEALLGTDLSAAMGALINPLTQLCMTIPNATIDTFLAAINDLEPFVDDIKKLPPRLREYLLTEAASQKPTIGAATKAAVRSRVTNVLFRSPHFERMFSAAKNKVNVADHLDRGRVLLINTNDRYGQEQAQLLGKYFVSRTLQALLQRTPNTAPPAFLYIDEAWMFLDKKVVNILRQARKYNVGLIVAEPDMAHEQEGLHEALAGVALLAGAGQVATRMPLPGVDSRFIASMKSHPPRSADFALFDRDRIPNTTRVTVPMFAMQPLSHISEKEYRAFRKRNRKRLEAPPAPEHAIPITDASGQEW